MAYQLLTMLAPIKSGGARPGIKRTGLRGVTIHMTDNWGKGAGAINHAKYLQGGGSNYQASWHYCIDDTYATNSIPEDEVSWQAGDGRGDGNYKTISIEICVNPESDLTEACDNAALLTADILKRHELPETAVFRHYDWSGKWCPSQMMNGDPYDWKTFKSKVADAYKGEQEKVETPERVPEVDDVQIGEGSTVYFDGKSHCYTQADGKGKQGSVPPAGEYKVTHYAPGQIYSIHIGSYGWVPATNCGLTPGIEDKPVVKEPEVKVETTNIKEGSTVYFDGKVACNTQSDGKGKQGSVPPAGNYKVTHYAKNAKLPIHIGSYGWVPAKNCGVEVKEQSKPVTETKKPSTTKIGVGSTVKFDGKSNCYATSAGTGKGMVPPAGNYKVTHYDKNAKFPIHIGSYGWVPAKNCGVNTTTKKPTDNKPAVGKTVYFDGKVACNTQADGKGKKGAVPPAGNYKITYYSEKSKLPIHIGSYGWVPAANCTVK